MIRIPKDLFDNPYKGTLKLSAKVIYAIALDKYVSTFDTFDADKCVEINTRELAGHGLQTRDNNSGVSHGWFCRGQLERLESFDLIRIEYPTEKHNGITKLEPVKIYFIEKPWLNKLFKEVSRL